MIVPRTPLIVLTAVVLLPVTLAAASYPRLLPAAWIVAGCWLAIAMVDAHSRRAALNAVRISISEVLRMTVDRETLIPIHVRRSPGAALHLRLRLGVALPVAIASRSGDLWCDLQVHQEAAVAEWGCRPHQRGRFRLTRCHAELPSRWRLWGLRKQFDLDTEMRIYPDLVSGRKELAGIFRPEQWGLRTRRRIGKGREFEQLRDYLPGDSYEDVDWKATARRRVPITRVYQVEQAQELYVILDASRLSTRNAAFLTDRRRRPREGQDAPRTTIFECFITAALVMALAAERAADRYGLLVFSDTPNGLIKAGRGRAHYNACRDALYNRMPDAVAPDFNELFTFMGAHLRKRALLVILTSLDDPVLSESFLHTVSGMARRHVMMVNMLRPRGAHPLFSVSDVRETAGIYQHLAGHLIWSTLEETGRQLKRQGVGFHLLDHASLAGQLVNQYMEVKQRQLL
jgi:uncharacterized protein (DUF58 family)